MSENALTRFLLIILVISYAQSGTSLECYVCTSTENAACATTLSGIERSTCSLDETTETPSVTTISTATPDSGITSTTTASDPTSLTTIVTSTGDSSSEITSTSDSGVTTDPTSSVTDSTVTTAASTASITDSSVTTEDSTASVTDSTVTTEDSTASVTDSTVTTEASTASVTDSSVTTEDSTASSTDSSVTTEDSTASITDSTVTTAGSTASITDSTVTTQASTTTIQGEVSSSSDASSNDVAARGIAPQVVRVVRAADVAFACYTLTVIKDNQTVTDRGCVVEGPSMCDTLNQEKYPENNLTACATCTEDGCNSSPINLSGIPSLFLPLIMFVLTR